MLIATRVITLRGADGDVEVPVRLYAPEQEAGHWSCRFEIGWPEGAVTNAASGEDAVQALELCMKIIGTLIYTSEHHKSGNLMWLEPSKGYGFPVPRTIRDLLVGDDERFL
jgi:hypothetical protein